MMRHKHFFGLILIEHYDTVIDQTKELCQTQKNS